MNILEIIRAKRKSLGITQEKMAKLLCMPKSTYNNLENNVIQLKVADFFTIIKILEIPLELFQDKKYIIVRDEDLEILMKSAEQIQTVTKRIENNISIVNNETINMKFDHVEFKNPPKAKRCAICGEPAGFYPLCKHHLDLKQQGKVIKNSKGYWVLKEDESL